MHSRIIPRVDDSRSLIRQPILICKTFSLSYTLLNILIAGGKAWTIIEGCSTWRWWQGILSSILVTPRLHVEVVAKNMYGISDTSSQQKGIPGPNTRAAAFSETLLASTRFTNFWIGISAKSFHLSHTMNNGTVFLGVWTNWSDGRVSKSPTLFRLWCIVDYRQDSLFTLIRFS